MGIKRGIILRPIVKNNTINGNIDDQLLRKLVMYWDFLDYPMIMDNNTRVAITCNYTINKDLSLLKQEGILDQSYVVADNNIAKVMSNREDFNNGYTNKDNVIQNPKIDNIEMFKLPFGISQIELCKHRNSADKNTIWSIGDLNDDISEFFFGKKNFDAIQMEFYNFLPIPKKEVPLDKILEFKLKRISEILHLRTAIDELSSIVIKSENLEDGIKRKKEEIDKCLLGLHRVLDENKIQKICTNLNMYLNIKENEILKYFNQAGIISIIINNLQFGFVLGLGINILLKIGTKKVSKIDKLPENLRNYLYVYDVETKLK